MAYAKNKQEELEILLGWYNKFKDNIFDEVIRTVGDEDKAYSNQQKIYRMIWDVFFSYEHGMVDDEDVMEKLNYGVDLNLSKVGRFGRQIAKSYVNRYL